MRVNGLSDIDRVSPHFDSETDFPDHIAGMRSDDHAPDDATAFRRAAQVAQGDVELWRGKVRVEPIAEA